MPYVPPWLNVTPEYFLNAIRAGSQAGSEMAANALRARSITQQGEEAASRNALGFAQLAQHGSEAAAEQQMAAARIREAQAQQAALQNYRDQLEQNRESDNMRADQMLQVTQNREALAQSREDRLAALQEANAHKPLIRSAGLDIVKVDPDTQNVTQLYRAKPSSGGSRLADALGLTGGTGTSPLPTSGPKPMPSKKSDLVKGTMYQTKFGPAEWDGEKFVTPKQ